MKNPILKSVLIAGMALSPLMLSAQTKGGTASGAGPASGTTSGTSAGEAARPTADRERDAAKTGIKDNQDNEGRMRNNSAMFDRLDADKDGSISREEFAKMGAQRNRAAKDRNNADSARPQTGDKANRKNRSPQAGDETDAKKNTEGKDTEVKDEDVKDATTPSSQPATGTTGTTGGTGSSASSAGQSGSANSGTGVRPQ